MIKYKCDPSHFSWFDCSSMCDARRCPAKFFFSHILKLDSGIPAPALEFGTAIHCAMPYVQRGELKKAIAAFDNHWTNSGCAEDAKRNRTNGHSLLQNWLFERTLRGAIPYRIIPPPASDLDPSERYSDDEYCFAVDLGARVPFVGRCDAVARDKTSGELCVIEYKTSSELGVRAASTFKQNAQIIGYVVATEITINEHCSRNYVEIVRVSKEPAQLCSPILVSNTMKSQFVETFCHTVEEVLSWISAGQFRQDRTGCNPYGMFGSHGYPCAYETLCSTEHWQQFLPAFETSNWKPFKSLT